MGSCNKKIKNKCISKLLNPENTKDFEPIKYNDSPKGNTEIIAISKENILKYYKFEKFLGSGGFGTGFFFTKYFIIINKQFDKLDRETIKAKYLLLNQLVNPKFLVNYIY